MSKWIALVLGLLTFANPSFAQTYPSKPIRWIVPFTAGSTSDTVCRILQPELSRLLGQFVVIENRPGAGGSLGTTEGAKAAPDGYTVTYASSSAFATNVHLMRLAYRPVEDFAPVSMIGATPYVLVAHPSVEANTVRELIAFAKAQPGKLSYASPGNGTGSHLSMESFKATTKTDIKHIPYKGSSPAVVDLVAGHVQLLFEPVASVGPHVKSGKLKALAVGSDKRIAKLPEVPTFSEAGIEEFEPVLGWFGAAVPSGTPPEIVATLNAAFVTALDTVRARLTDELGIIVRPTAPEKFGEFIRSEIPRFGKIIAVSGIKVD
ncbi:Bug family tripartite tricarboxylate transporter substrate binding protein [Piscinibacter sakaiensis]|uniref:Bug family tripartite tricarboxylate transporter substrate binding protein n=1 Tax=Piscinibacter sakaiensis TaxID=1547922 RepID=UPI003AAB5152